jgi:hypothetical protein
MLHTPNLCPMNHALIRMFSPLAFILLLPLCSIADTSEVVIESFTSVKPFAVGSEAVFVSGTVRNKGTAPVPANAAGLRIYSLAGLDYAEGDLAPKLPELMPDTTATFKWKLLPSRTDGPLVVSLALEQPGRPPAVKIIAIPHLVNSIPPESAAVNKTAVASASRGRSHAVIENSHIRVRIVRAEANIPILLVSSHSAGGWRQAGVCMPIAEVYSAEGGQRPWWEQFKIEDDDASITQESGTISLSGSFGLRWRATLDLTLRTESSVLDVRLRLAPNRPLRISGLRFCPLLAGAGSFGNSATEALGPVESGPNFVSAVRWGELTVGVLRSGVPLVNGWETDPISQAQDAEYKLFAVETRGKEGAAPVSPGALLEIRARLFCFAPSLTVRDAFRVAFPSERIASDGSFPASKAHSAPRR